MGTIGELWENHSAVVVVVVLLLLVLLVGWMGYLPGCMKDLKDAKDALAKKEQELVGQGGEGPKPAVPAS